VLTSTVADKCRKNLGVFAQTENAVTLRVLIGSQHVRYQYRAADHAKMKMPGMHDSTNAADARHPPAHAHAAADSTRRDRTAYQRMDHGKMPGMKKP